MFVPKFFFFDSLFMDIEIIYNLLKCISYSFPRIHFYMFWLSLQIQKHLLTL